MPERASGWERNHIYLLFTWSRTPTHCTLGALYGCLHGPDHLLLASGTKCQAAGSHSAELVGAHAQLLPFYA